MVRFYFNYQLFSSFQLPNQLTYWSDLTAFLQFYSADEFFQVIAWKRQGKFFIFIFRHTSNRCEIDIASFHRRVSWFWLGYIAAIIVSKTAYLILIIIFTVAIIHNIPFLCMLFWIKIWVIQIQKRLCLQGICIELRKVIRPTWFLAAPRWYTLLLWYLLLMCSPHICKLLFSSFFYFEVIYYERLCERS